MFCGLVASSSPVLVVARSLVCFGDFLETLGFFCGLLASLLAHLVLEFKTFSAGAWVPDELEAVCLGSFWTLARCGKRLASLGPKVSPEV